MRHRPVVTLVALVSILTACGQATATPAPSTLPPEPDGTDAPTSPAAPGSAAAGRTTEVIIGTAAGSELTFEPADVTVPAGAMVQVTFENRSDLPHNVMFGDPINAASSTVVDPGATETLEFTTPAAGTYPFVCTLHPGMMGSLIVEG